MRAFALGGPFHFFPAICEDDPLTPMFNTEGLPVLWETETGVVHPRMALKIRHWWLIYAGPAYRRGHWESGMGNFIQYITAAAGFTCTDCIDVESMTRAVNFTEMVDFREYVRQNPIPRHNAAGTRVVGVQPFEKIVEMVEYRGI